MRRVLVVSTVILTLLSASTVSFGQSDYSDVRQGNWAFESIDAMSQKAIITGYPDGTYRPGSEVTYAEFIRMMVAAVNSTKDGAKEAGSAGSTISQTVNASNVSQTGGTSSQNSQAVNSGGNTSQINNSSKAGSTGTGQADGDRSHWAAPYYEEALNLGLFHQDDITRANLDQPIPRGAMALVISAALGETEIPGYDAIEESVPDVNSRTLYDYHIIKTYAVGIMSGYPDKTFRPQGYLSRAEAAIVLHRFIDPAKRTPVTGEEPEAETGDEDEIIISQENSFNKELVWVKEGDIHEMLDQSAIDYLTALAPLKKYIIVEDASQFDLKMKSGPNYTWLEMKNDKAYYEAVSPCLITNGKISDIFDDSDVWRDGTCTVTYTGDISTMDYVVLSPAGGSVVTLIVNPFI